MFSIKLLRPDRWNALLSEKVREKKPSNQEVLFLLIPNDKLISGFIIFMTAKNKPYVCFQNKSARLLCLLSAFLPP